MSSFKQKFCPQLRKGRIAKNRTQVFKRKILLPPHFYHSINSPPLYFLLLPFHFCYYYLTRDCFIGSNAEKWTHICLRCILKGYVLFSTFNPLITISVLHISYSVRASPPRHCKSPHFLKIQF